MRIMDTSLAERLAWLAIATGLPGGAVSAAEHGALARQLAARDDVPAGRVEFESDYVARVNFRALLEPEDGIIHGAGQDPQSYREYSALFEPSQRPVMLMTYITVTAGPQEVADWRRDIPVLD